MDDLIHVEDISELLRRLEKTPYAEIVRHAREAFEESHDPFVLDATLDRAYFEGLVRRARPLERMAGNPLRDLMADLVDPPTWYGCCAIASTTACRPPKSIICW